MALVGWLAFALFALMQSVEVPLLKSDVLNSTEKAQLSRAGKTDDRIKIYQIAAARIQRTIHTAAANNDFSEASDALKLWISLLSGSLEDIEVNLKTTKKSRALIRYEIEVRKALTAFRNYRTKAPVEQQDVFDSYLTQAEKIRKRFVEIIFR